MKVFTRNAALSDELKRHPGTCGFVPTSLVEQCRRECDTVVVSIFVNPTQFNDPNDLKNYPRTVEADLALLEKAGADFALTPSVEDIYPEKDTRVFDFGLLDRRAPAGAVQRRSPSGEPPVRHRPLRQGLFR